MLFMQANAAAVEVGLQYQVPGVLYWYQVQNNW